MINARQQNYKQIISDMNEFDIDDVVSIFIGSTPDSEIHIEYEEESSEKESKVDPLCSPPEFQAI